MVCDSPFGSAGPQQHLYGLLNGFAFCVASSRSLRGIPDIDDYHHGLAHSDTLLLIINQECTLL